LTVEVAGKISLVAVGDTNVGSTPPHSAQWRSAASYVALTRHREAVHIFASRETIKDLDDMAKGMARADNKHAATAFSIDPHSAARAELDRAVGLSERPAAANAKEAKELTGEGERGERLRQRDDRQARDEITRNQRQRGERDRGGGMSR
jgi:hypothetical protein